MRRDGDEEAPGEPSLSGEPPAERERTRTRGRRREAPRDFRNLGKKMRLDAGLTIRTLAGGEPIRLEELLGAAGDSGDESDSEGSDADSESSDGMSEREFTVDPEAALQPLADESRLDPETGLVQTPEVKAPIEADSLRTEDTTPCESTEPDGPTPDEEPTSEADSESKTTEEDKSKSGSALNVRRNIREVMDENQLDASTLAAQRLELERLARVQEQQRIIREVRRQIALGRQDRTQARVLSLLQGRTGASVLKKPVPIDSSSLSERLNIPNQASVIPPGDPRRLIRPGVREPIKFPRTIRDLTPSVSIAPVRMDAPPGHDSKRDVVEIVDSSSSGSSGESGPSSDSDDCIMLSDSELPPSPEPDEDPQNSGLHVNDAYNVADEQGRVIINVGHPENDEDIFLAPQIGRIIKPHQIGGVRFLFDNIIESIERFSNSTGFGCILAHSMGLGKTLQIVCFCDIFLRHTSSKTVLCIMPINTLQNWVAEFNMWLPLDPTASPLAAHGEVRPRHFPIYVLNDSHKTLQARAKVIKEWNQIGGVLMIGYELYRLLSLKKNKKPRNRRKKNDPPARADKNDSNKQADAESSDRNLKDDLLDMRDAVADKKDEDEDTEEEKKLLDDIYEALVKPGPDLVICDEGHRIKNSHSNISFALKQMRTKRRVVLTGYPLQNNLLEYWCMVDFVRPNYLGTKAEFSNMFERPIQNGQCIDSTPQDIRLMRYRAHVLHSLLVGFVQRRSHAVLQTTLPQKEEYVLLIRMTDLQRKLYDIFMNDVVRKKTVPNPLKAFAVCCKIWNHPDVLYYFLKKRNELIVASESDAEIEDNTNVKPAIEGTATLEIEDDKTPKKTRAPKKREKKSSPKNDPKPAATINPNVNVLPVDQNKPPPAETFQVKSEPNQNFNYNTAGNASDKPFETSASKDSSNGFPAYEQPQYQHENYYGQNETYPPNFNNEYYNNQSYNYNNYNASNSTAPQPPPAVEQNPQQYPESSNFNSQNYWGGNDNYYNNSNPNYYPEQHQQPQQPPNFTENNSYEPIYDGYNRQNPSFNEYESNAQKEHAQNFNENFPDSSAYPQVDNNASQSAATNNTFNGNPIYSTYENNESATADSEKSTLHDDISTLCWPVGDENIKSEHLPVHNALAEIKKEEKNADSDGEIKIADLDTMKVIVDEKSSLKFKEEEKPEIKEAPKTEEVKPEKVEPIKAPETGKKKPERKPRERKPKEKKERKPRAVKEPKEKNKPKDNKKKDNVLRDIDIDIEGVKDDKKSEKYEEVNYDWAYDLLRTYVPGIIENSAKMEIFFCILEESVKIGDRLLLFSQSLFTLSLIEDYLQKNIIPGTETNWAKNKSYYRLDGSTSALEREKLINEFNSNANIHLFLVSTRAGSLGINLVGANRVIVFDASWNPCHDTQAVCRVYRYGQKKPCFVYRFVMDFCLEKRIYDRQINKQGMSDRVVDECNPDAVLSMKEVTNLCWDGKEQEEYTEIDKQTKDKYVDSIMQKIIDKHSTILSKIPFQHESLLVDRKEKKLSSAEKRLAQRSYELEKKAASNPKPSLMYRTIRSADGTLIQRPVASVRPMQHPGTGSGGTRWIPADVWQRQGMTAQEMTLPLDVVIPTNSAEKNSIVLKAGQKVMVLKSPKGIYMQLESGKIIAIKTSFKVGQNKALVDIKEPPNQALINHPPNINLPGSLKNNTAITVISKSARGGINKMAHRPPIIPKKAMTSIRPIINRPRMYDPKMRPMQSNMAIRPYSLIRGRSVQIPRAARPIPIQNNLNIKIQGPSVRPPFDMNRNPEGSEYDEEYESGLESAEHSDFVHYGDDETVVHRDGDGMDGVESYDMDALHAASSANVDGLMLEDLNPERTYGDLPDELESKLTAKLNKKTSLKPLPNIGNLFKECNIQIKSSTNQSSPLDVAYMNNVTIKRTLANPSASFLKNSDVDGPSTDYGLALNSDLSDDNADSEGVKERKTYKPNLVDRKNNKMNSLKNYRHPKMNHKPGTMPSNFPLDEFSSASASSAPTSPLAFNVASNSQKSQDRYESTLSQLEKTASSISQSPRKGMSDFQQSLNDITQTYSPNSEGNPEIGGYKPGPKSRKKKNASPPQTDRKIGDDKVKPQTEYPPQAALPSPNVAPMPNYSQPYPQEPLGPAAGYPDVAYQQVPPTPDNAAQPPYNSYPGYPASGGSYPPYPAAPYYQHYPPGYPAYPQYPAPPPAYPPASYPPNPYPGYPYPNSNTNQW